MDLLRFLTAGNVDDGKSTLIGRLLYDSKSILADQLHVLEERGRSIGKTDIDLASLTDGLRSEREQGITIDVAYKYFSTPRRKFIIADTPGHLQYTRNMVTGASTADAVVILIDARSGITEQTRRHSIIASLLGIKHVVVAINKMDLVDYEESVYTTIIEAYENIISQLDIQHTYYIPVSALLGHNIVEKSEIMQWYSGKSLLHTLETIPLNRISTDSASFTMMVQHVMRPQESDLHDFRGYAGKIFSGSIKVGDTLRSTSSGIQTKVTSKYSGGIARDHVSSGSQVTLELEDDLDISRGDILTQRDDLIVSSDIVATICWMDETALQSGQRFILQHHSRRVRALVKSLDYLIDIQTVKQIAQPESVPLNGLARIQLKTQSSLYTNLIQRVSSERPY
jgi:sulfate adenylyltransferase subunit 1